LKNFAAAGPNAMPVRKAGTNPNQQQRILKGRKKAKRTSFTQVPSLFDFQRYEPE
jgi:hypothetical protein